MKEIQLTQGKVALVDDEDYEEIAQYKWFAHKKTNTYYAETNRNKKTFGMHKLVTNTGPNQLVDHINGNGLDNRRCNLRLCTESQNHMNRKNTCGKSKYKGVISFKRDNKWVARIQKDKQCFHLGVFIEEEEAAKAYDNAAKKLFGEFANLNFKEV